MTNSESLVNKLKGLVPQLSTAKLVGYIVAGLLAIGALWFVVDRVFFAPQRAATEVATTIVEASIAQGDANAAESAVDIVVTTEETKQIIRDRVSREEGVVRNAPDAETEVPGVTDALRQSVCLHSPAYNGHPDCQRYVQPVAGSERTD